MGVAAATSIVLAACSPAPAPISPHPSPSRSEVPTPTTAPLPTPSPTATPAPPPVPPGRVPKGFNPNSVTFVSLETGWVLGSAPCSSGVCLALLRTSDAGRHWSAVAAPPTSFSGSYAADGVDQVRFADPSDGWAFGPQLWSTHDGGVHWSESALSGVWTLEAADGRVHAVSFDGNGNYAIESSVTNRDAWLPTGSLQLGAGPVPFSDVVLERNTGWVVENDRTVIDGARLVAGRWTPWNPPCATNGGTAVISASTTSSLVAVCGEGYWGPSGYPGPPATRAYFSNNGGATWYHGGTFGQASGAVVASPFTGAAVTDILTATRRELVETFNGGASWSVVLSNPWTVGFSYLGFTSPSQGVAIEMREATSALLLMTFNGGRSWSPVSF
jgi:hypothetical protein